MHLPEKETSEVHVSEVNYPALLTNSPKALAISTPLPGAGGVDKLPRVAVEGKLQRWRPGRDTAALPQNAFAQAVDASACTNEFPEMQAVYHSAADCVRR